MERYYWNGEDWELRDYTNMSIDPELDDGYWDAVNAEFHAPILRTWEEWQKINAPKTKDDIIDTMLFIRRLPSC